MIAETEIFSLIAPYRLSLLAMTVLCLAVIIQSFLLAPLAFLSGEQQPGKPLSGDHSQFSFRVVRTHYNSVENLPIIGIALFLAILLGVNPTFVNYALLIHVGFRLLFWFVYYKGIGKVAGGIRTFSFVGGIAANLALVGAILFQFFA